MGSANVDSSKINQWQKLSWHNIRSKWSDNFTHPFRFDFEGMASNTIAYIDDAMLIDLTAAFGAGNEPTQEWCDANIEYFAGNKTIQYTAPNKYDLTVTTPTKIQTGDILNCPYSGSMKSVILPKGTYVLECWGAQGGTGNSNTSYPGGKGGYSKGTITLNKKTNLYLYTGGQGLNGTTYNSNGATTAGGFNGGGSATSQNSRGSGGGGTDIRIGIDSLYARVLVAGGGSGSSGYVSSAGFAGGGISGKTYNNQDSTNGSSYYGGGGSQTKGGAANTDYAYGTAGSFGQGGNYNASSNTYYGSGGGGGWYGGGGAIGIGGGGSGYMYTASSASYYPSGCLLNSQYYLENATTLAGNTAFTSPTGASETGHTGNGYIRITVIQAQSGNTLIKFPQTLPSTYNAIEYLQFTGTQYIDTGVTVDSNTGFDITFEVLNGQSGSPYYNLFGVRGNDASGGTGENQNFFRIDTIPVDSNSGTEFKYGSTIYNSGIKNTSKINIKLLNKVYTKPDGSTITVAGTITTGLSMHIGCINKAGTAYGNKASMKLYRFKIYNGSTLTHDFIPVQRVSDKVLGLYDLKTSTFKINAASDIPFTSNLMNDSSSLVYFNGDSLQSQSNLSLTITKNNVTLSNEQTHFGKNSLKFDGSSSYMYMPFPSTYTGDITLEGWFYQTSNNNTSYPTPFTLISSAGRGMYMHRLSSQTFVAATPSNSWPGLDGGTTALNTWTHIAMCLSTTGSTPTTYCFLDGKLKGTLTNTNTSYVGLTLGTLAGSASDNHSSGCYYKGYIAELKITKGCKWTKDFTLPTTAYGTAKDSNPWKEPVQMFVNTGASNTVSSGLVELEYIESTGVQAIDTLVIAKDITKVVTDFQLVSVVSGTESQVMAVWSDVNNCMQCGSDGTNFMATSRGTTYSQTSNVLARTIGTSAPIGSPNISISIFAQNNTGWLSKTKLYSCKIYKDTTLVRDFVPAKRVRDGICGLWDKVNYKFYTDINGNNFTASSEKSIIASVGTPIEYIQSSGTQYIDTGVLGSDIKNVKVDFQFTSTQSTTEQEVAALFSGSNKLQIGWNASSFISSEGATYSQTAYSARTIANASPIGSPTITLYLFAQHEGNTAKHNSSVKIYSCIITTTSGIIYNFIPIKTTTNTYGLWDKVNKVFYPNAGTGTFTGGSAITLSGWCKIKGVWAKTAADTWSQTL